MNDHVGQQIGDYRLNSLIGGGEFGDVYFVEHIYLGTFAAIKLLRLPLDNDEAETFRTKGRTIAHLAHPNIIHVLEFGVTDAIPYLVMDYAPRATLRQRHSPGTLVPLDVVISYVKQIADALFYAHEQGVIHGDVKPQNMLIGQDNEILLSDFSTANLASNTKTRPSQDFGATSVYMAPEVFKGMLSQVSDQYSLGVVVYEWLCGYPPFEGSLSDIVKQVATVSPPSLREKNPEITSPVEQVVLKALEKTTHYRFPDVLKFVKTLEQVALQQKEEIISYYPVPESIHTSSLEESYLAPPVGQEESGQPTKESIMEVAGGSSPHGSETYLSQIQPPPPPYQVYPNASI